MRATNNNVFLATATVAAEVNESGARIDSSIVVQRKEVRGVHSSHKTCEHADEQEDMKYPRTCLRC